MKTECELAEKVVAWLRGREFRVYQEVASPWGGVVDIVAVKNDMVWAIETKIAFGLAVVEQAVCHLQSASHVSVATHSRVRRGALFLEEACEWKGIGWIEVDRWHSRPVQETLTPRRLGEGFRLREVLRPEHETFCHAGSAAGGHWTLFKATCIAVRDAVTATPGLTVAEVVARISTHYKQPATARNSIRHWAQRGKIPGVRIDMAGAGGVARLFPDAATARQEWSGA